MWLNHRWKNRDRYSLSCGDAGFTADSCL